MGGESSPAQRVQFPDQLLHIEHVHKPIGGAVHDQRWDVVRDAFQWEFGWSVLAVDRLVSLLVVVSGESVGVF